MWLNREKLYTLSKGPRQVALVWKIARNAIIDDLRRTPVSETLPEEYDTKEEDRS